MASEPFPRWDVMTTAEVRAFAREDPVVVLPLAAIEQHGPHLPLSTDVEIGRGILTSAFRHMPVDFPGRVLPLQPVGASIEHLRFPGTLSLTPELLGGVIFRIGASLARHGIGRLLLFNSHGGNGAALDSAGLALREEHGLLVVKASYFHFPRPETVALPEAEWRHGLHGGAVETAMMLHLRPDLVRVREVERAASLGEELEGTLRRIGPEEEVPFAWLAGDLTPTGVTGDPTLADAAMGARLVEHYGTVLSDVIRDARAFPLERLGRGPLNPP